MRKIKTKKCTGRCGREKPLNEFGKLKSSKDGLRYECKACKREESRKWRESNPDYNKNYYKENRDKIRQNQEVYWQEYYSYEQNREKHRNYNKQYRKDNREDINEKARIYKIENIEKYREGNKKWEEQNKENRNEITRRYRERKSKLASTLTKEEWNDNLQYFNSTCAYCGTDEEDLMNTYEKTLEKDHLVPVLKNGGYEKKNIVPSCHLCNSTKSSKDFLKWYPGYEHFTKERFEKIIDLCFEF